MSIPLDVNGQVFEYPEDHNENWGVDATGWAQAVTNGMLQMAGGSFPLTADVNFGPNFGLLSKYFETRVANPASTGVVRLAKTDVMAWRNNANSADLVLGIDISDNLTFNGSSQSFTGAVNPGTANQLAYYATSGDAVSGLTAITANRALQSNASGLPVASTVTSTTLAFLDATSSVQTQLNSISTVANAALPKSGGTMTGNLNMGANRIQNMAEGVNPDDGATVSQVSTSTPPGTIVMYGGASAPTGWLMCDGTSYATATYPALFAAIVYAFGGSGANFNVPNLVNNVPVGQGGSIAGSLGATSGATTHTLTVAEIPAGLTVTDPGHVHQLHTYTTTAVNGLNPTGQTGVDQGASPSFGAIVSNTTGISVGGGGTAHSIVQPSIGLNFIIKT